MTTTAESNGGCTYQKTWSKIEDSAHTFIETARNVWYKFRDGV